jgi:hypothetical protein
MDGCFSMVLFPKSTFDKNRLVTQRGDYIKLPDGQTVRRVDNIKATNEGVFFVCFNGGTPMHYLSKECEKVYG